jgi:hypothetical protein
MPFAASLAHEVRPAYLELREEKAGEWSVLFKTPLRGDARLAAHPAQPVTVAVVGETGAALRDRQRGDVLGDPAHCEFLSRRVTDYGGKP